jgi:hypothetical protein
MLAAPTTSAAALPRVFLRTWSARLVLGTIVLVSTAGEALLARLRVTPAAFPDEYVYSALARSLATSGRLRVHGATAHFPALLVPILTAPVWFVHDVGTAYHLLQLENAFVMSLAAIPAYLIARRLKIGTSMALALAALAVAGPQLLFVAMLQSEPFAYPLALSAFAAALAAIDRPTLSKQALFVLLAGLAAVARVQLAVLPLCAAAAIIVVAARERRLRAGLREQRLLLGAIAAGLLVGLTVVLVHGIGYYRLAPAATGPASALRMAGIDGFVVLLASGVALVPSGLVGLALALARPRSRTELAYGALAVTTAAGLLLQAVLWGDVHLVQERYLGYLVPLLGLGFALRCSRRPRRALPEVGIAAGIACVAALVPLSGYAIAAQHGEAPVLYGFDRLMVAWHSASAAAGAFAIGVTVLAAAGAALAASRQGAPAALALSAAASISLLVGAASFAGLTNRSVRHVYLPADRNWVDTAANGSSTMLVAPGASRDQALATLFWNPSVTRVVRLPQAKPIDQFYEPHVSIDARGTVRVAGRPLEGPVLAEGVATAAVLRDARPLARWTGETLWLPRRAAQLSVLVNGRLPDGRLLAGGRLQVWDPSGRLAGWIELRLRAPSTGKRSQFVLVGASGARASFSVAAGAERVVRVPACGAGPWSRTFSTEMLVVSGAPVTMTLALPRYVRDPAACG